jgi:hypothetical protein
MRIKRFSYSILFCIVDIMIHLMLLFYLCCVPTWQQQYIQQHYRGYQLMGPIQEPSQPAGTSFYPHRRHASYLEQKNNDCSDVPLRSFVAFFSKATNAVIINFSKTRVFLMCIKLVTIWSSTDRATSLGGSQHGQERRKYKHGDSFMPSAASSHSIVQRTKFTHFTANKESGTFIVFF